MNRRGWLVALAVTAVALVAFGGSSLIAQDAGKKPANAQGKDVKQAKAEREATFKKLFPTAKTSLMAGMKTAEDANKGAHVHSVEYELAKDGKTLEIEVGMLVGDKLTKVYVDPDTGKIKEHTDAKKAENGKKSEKDEDGEEDDDD